MQKVANVSEVNDKLCISLKDKNLALFKIEDKFYCIDNECSHAGGPLCEGNVDGSIVTCPWHDSKFDVKTGNVTSGPARENVKSYKVTVKDGEVYVDV